MNAPAIPPPPAPIKARSKTERCFISVWIFGLLRDAGFIHFRNPGPGLESETEADANGGDGFLDSVRDFFLTVGS